MSCNGCRVLRKGCSESCLLRPCLASVEGADSQGHATLFLAKFFGRAGLMGFIAAVNEAQRPALFQSLLYEACGRTINPVYGSAGLLWSGQWHLCEAAVESVLKGGTPSSCFTNGSTPTLSSSPSPLRQCPSPLPPCPSPSLTQQNMLNSMNMNRAVQATNPMSTFPFPVMDPSGMAYLPLAMAPMANSMNPMAAMGGVASAGAYQQTYQNNGCPMPVPSYLTTNNTMACNMMPPQSINHMQASASQMWASEAMVGQQAAAAVQRSLSQQGVYTQAVGGSSSPVSDSGSVVDSLSGMHCSSPPLVAPVARRITASQTSGFAPPSSQPMQYTSSARGSVMGSGAMLRGDHMSLCMPEWATRAAADPASHSLLPLLS